ncbi:hypothetical protein N9M10_02635 [Hellea sp.]|nr:hypothetical protein [Hellea sp.]
MTFDIDGKISRKGPEAKCSLVSDGAKIVGEIIEIGDIEESHRFKPVEVMKPKDISRDKVIF